VVGYSRLAGADEDRTVARLRTLRSDLIEPTLAVHHGHIVKRTGDGSIIEFRSVVDAVNCAIEIQRAMVERNAEVARRRPDGRWGITAINQLIYWRKERTRNGPARFCPLPCPFLRGVLLFGKSSTLRASTMRVTPGTSTARKTPISSQR
jgi:hypothetical protein